MYSTSAAHRGTAACLQAFAQVQQVLKITTSGFKDQLSPPALEDELGRFRIWAANIGALQRGHSSLDYRLKDAPLVHENVLKLLRELCSTLLEISLVLSGTRLPYDMEPRPDSYGEQSNSSSDSDTISEDSLDSSESFPSTSELQQRFSSVVDIIDNLYKLSRSIRLPAFQTRVMKAALYKKVNKDTGVDLITEFSTVDLAYTTELFRQLRRESVNIGVEDAKLCEEDHILIKRIASSITQRRQQFMYWRRHRDKLSIQATDEDFGVRTMPTQQAQVDVAKEAENPLSHAIPAEEKSDIGTRHDVKSAASKTALTATTATVFLPIEAASDNGQSTTSFATTARGLDGSRVEFPHLPKTVKAGKDFECPYCFTICPAKYQAARIWRMHLLRDLRPYVCTYLCCRQPGQLFGSRFDWLEHERANHRKSWRCPEHSKEHFSTFKAFEVHLQAIDHSILSKMPTTELVAISESSDSDPRRSCSICLATLLSADDLHKHFANHLERFASFAFPRDVETSGDDDLSAATPEMISDRADARSDESYDLERFTFYTRQDLQAEINCALEAAHSLLILSYPTLSVLDDFMKTYFGYRDVISEIRQKIRDFEEELSSDRVDLLTEQGMMVMKQVEYALQRLLNSCHESDKEEWVELHEQLDIQNAHLSTMLDYLKTSQSANIPTSSLDVQSSETSEQRHTLTKFLIAGPRKQEPDQLVIQDQVAKEEFVTFITAGASVEGNLARCCMWYTQFLESRMKLTWTHLFGPILSGLSDKSLKPRPGDLAIAYTFFIRLARLLQNYPVPLTLKYLVDAEPIRGLWNLRHPKSFWTLTFCSVGWLTLLYQPHLDPGSEALQLANHQLTSSATTMWDQITLPLPVLLATTSAYIPLLPSRVPQHDMILYSPSLWQGLFKSDLKLAWTETLSDHLKLHKPTRTVSLFCFPSFCRIMYRSAQKGVITGRYKLYSDFFRFSSEGTSVDYFRNSKHFDAKLWTRIESSLLEAQVDNNRDPMVEVLCRQSNSESARRIYDEVGLTDYAFRWSDFQFLRTQLIEVLEHSIQDRSGESDVPAPSGQGNLPERSSGLPLPPLLDSNDKHVSPTAHSETDDEGSAPLGYEQIPKAKESSMQSPTKVDGLEMAEQPETAPSTWRPLHPAEQVDEISLYFHATILPFCVEYADSPLMTQYQRDFEFERLCRKINDEVYKKLDAIPKTDGDAMQKTRDLLVEVDRVVHSMMAVR